LAGTAIAVVTAASTAFAPAASALQYGMTLSPDKVKPGGTISVTIKCPYNYLTGRVRSDGFAALITLEQHGQGTFYGQGKVVEKPGRYEVSYYCKGASPLTAQFTVLDGKPVPKPKVPVKPKGAPQTGEGTV
jgi:hypothetical protein